uniref:CSON005403 protein n=1 Tax=Culicoides sonorensis TaxID=179676 RepID=A0A336MQE6_CULSO
MSYYCNNFNCYNYNYNKKEKIVQEIIKIDDIDVSKYKSFQNERWSKFLENGEHTDVIFKCPDDDCSTGHRNILAHKIVIASVSEVFETMFYGSLSENLKKEMDKIVVEIPDIKAPVFELMLRAIYGMFYFQTIPKETDEQTLYELLYAAEKYQLKDLKNYLENQICKIVSYKNALKAFEFAEKHACTILEGKCLSIIEENIHEIFKCDDIFTVQPETINKIFQFYCRNVESDTYLINILQRYIMKNKDVPEIEAKVRPALNSIRFLTLDEFYIKTTILLTDEEIQEVLDVICNRKTELTCGLSEKRNLRKVQPF